MNYYRQKEASRRNYAGVIFPLLLLVALCLAAMQSCDEAIPDQMSPAYDKAVRENAKGYVLDVEQFNCRGCHDGR